MTLWLQKTTPKSQYHNQIDELVIHKYDDYQSSGIDPF